MSPALGGKQKEREFVIIKVLTLQNSWVPILQPFQWEHVNLSQVIIQNGRLGNPKHI